MRQAAIPVAGEEQVMDGSTWVAVVVVAVVVAVVLGLVLVALPDIRRYRRIRRM